MFLEGVLTEKDDIFPLMMYNSKKYHCRMEGQLASKVMPDMDGYTVLEMQPEMAHIVEDYYVALLQDNVLGICAT